MMAPSVFGLRTYPVAIACAVVVAVLLTVRLGREAGLRGGRVLAAHAVVTAAGLLGARLHAVIESGAPWLSILLPGGLRYPGGLVAVLLVLPLLGVGRGVPAGLLGDVTAPGVAVAMAIARVGCLLHGCCYGRLSSLPWALSFPAHSPAWSDQLQAGLIGASATQSLPVHPLQVYFAVWSLAVASLLFTVRRRTAYAGQLLLLFLALHEGGKCALESLRAPSPLWHLQLPALLVALGAGAALVAGRLPVAGSWRSPASARDDASRRQRTA